MSMLHAYLNEKKLNSKQDFDRGGSIRPNPEGQKIKNKKAEN